VPANVAGDDVDTVGAGAAVEAEDDALLAGHLRSIDSRVRAPVSGGGIVSDCAINGNAIGSESDRIKSSSRAGPDTTPAKSVLAAGRGQDGDGADR
jgi:hypothetical protein